MGYRGMSFGSAGFLAVADRIGCKLCRDAVWAGNGCNWLGWALVPYNGNWVPAYRAQSAGLYDGIAGIAHFLTHVYRFTQDPRLLIALNGALDQLRRALASPDPL